MVMAQSLFIHLKQQYGEAAVIDVVAPGWSLPVLERMPQVRRGIALDVAHGEFGWRKRMDLGKRLRFEKYDRAIVIPKTWKSALVPFFARVPIRTGFLGEVRFGLLNDIRSSVKAGKQTVVRYLSLGLNKRESPPDIAAVPAPGLSCDGRTVQETLKRFGLSTDKPVVALFPGAEYGPAKQWPVEHFSTLAKMLTKEEKTVWVFGSKKERVLGQKIAEASAAHNLCGETTLAEAIDLISAAQAAVTNDSGLMHVASALGVPLVAIYGSSSPAKTPPLSKKAEIVQRDDLDCIPCFKKRCPLGHTECLWGIKADDIYKALTKKSGSPTAT
jgi:heptosyltransferase-2